MANGRKKGKIFFPKGITFLSAQKYRDDAVFLPDCMVAD